MKEGKIVGFNASEIKAQLMANAVAEQNRRLVEYAKSTIQEIGDTIKTYSGGHHMDDKGNLLDSLCWGLSYKGKVVESGFYREQKATELTYLHAWFHDNTEPIGGHVLAQNFMKRMANLNYSGWRLFFAILAPYWGYWEKGFKMKIKAPSYQEGDAVSFRFMRFAVMTQFLDRIEKDLKPAKVTFKTEAPTYTKESWSKLGEKRDSRAAKKGGFSVYDKYPRGKGKGKYNY